MRYRATAILGCGSFFQFVIYMASTVDMVLVLMKCRSKIGWFISGPMFRMEDKLSIWTIRIYIICPKWPLQSQENVLFVFVVQNKWEVSTGIKFAIFAKRISILRHVRIISLFHSFDLFLTRFLCRTTHHIYTRPQVFKMSGNDDVKTFWKSLKLITIIRIYKRYTVYKHYGHC